MVLIDFKGYIHGQNGPILDLCLSIYANVSETVHAVTNVFMKAHIQSRIWSFS